MKLHDSLLYEIEEIPIKDIVVGPRGDRTSNQSLEIDALAKDMQENGQHTEIWLNAIDGELRLVAGNRRYLAALQINNKTLRAKIYSNLNPLQCKYLQATENSNRLNYDKFEKMDIFSSLFYDELKILSKDEQMPHEAPPMRLFEAMNQAVNLIRNNDNSTKKIDCDRTEKRVTQALENAYLQSGLYGTYSSLHKDLQIIDISDNLRKAGKKYNLSIHSILKIKKFEKAHPKTRITLDNEERVLLTNHFFTLLESLENKSVDSISSLLKKVVTMGRKLHGEVNRDHVLSQMESILDSLQSLERLKKGEVTKISKKINALKLEIDKILSAKKKQEL